MRRLLSTLAFISVWVPINAAAWSPCKEGAHVTVTAPILLSRPPADEGRPWSLDLDKSQGECDIDAIQLYPGKPPASCVDGSTATASGQVKMGVLLNPGDLSCAQAGQAQQSAGWFDWLWGNKKPAEQPAPPQPSTRPTVAAAPPSANPAQPSAPAGAVPAGCPVGKPYGGWTIRKGSIGDWNVVTARSTSHHKNTANNKWTTDGLSLELVPLKNGEWRYFLFVKNLRKAGVPVAKLDEHYAVSIWDSTTKKDILGVERDHGGNTFFAAPFTIVGLPNWLIDDAAKAIESAPQVNFALSLPREDGRDLTDVAWISPTNGSGLRAAMAAAKACAVVNAP